MMRRTKKLWMRVGAVAIIGVAFASAALAADSTGIIESNASVVSAANVAGSVSLPAAAQATAAAVLHAIAGGANPSAAASERSDPESGAQAQQGGSGQSLISAAQRLLSAGTAGTVGVRPGWGCGDKNHKHSGPPGRPNADPPPGCPDNR